MKILAIGDPHIRMDNIDQVELYIDRITEIVCSVCPDQVVILGDVLHCHERLHTSALNRAHAWIDSLRQIVPVYVLVGNHDYINNSQFLTSNHWMNAMKKWNNVTIVDQVVSCGDVLYCPYVFPGKFREALDTLTDSNWRDARVIFAHQEFLGCKMGAIVSQEGDDWTDPDLPLVVSGHVHDRQWVNSNVYYTGSSMQHAFGESGDKTLAVIDTSDRSISEISTNLPRKRIVYLTVDQLDSYAVPEGDQIRLTVTGSYDAFKAFRKSTKYAKLAKQTKIIYRIQEGIDEIKKKERTEDSGEPNREDERNEMTASFTQVLLDSIQGNSKLMDIYNQVFV